MTKSKMPEAVAVVVSDYAIVWAESGPIAPLCERTGAKVGSQLITTDQSKSYADARVREALEEAARICDRLYEIRAESGFPREASTARALAAGIRALIQQENES